MLILQKKFLLLPIDLRKKLTDFSRIFDQNGFECFLVGGSCRDILLGESPHDFDFATNCPLSRTKAMFPKVISIGEQHGTLQVHFSGLIIEITRYRKKTSTDSREIVWEFADRIEEDLSYRDFRINAIAYDLVHDTVVDSQGGIRDYENKVLHFTGSAQERILEDPLRGIRYFRLITKLKPRGFSFDPNELSSVIQHFQGDALAWERVLDEIEKINRIPEKEIDFLAEHLSALGLFDRFFLAKESSAQVLKKIFTAGNILPLALEYRKNHSLKDVAQDLKLSKINAKMSELLFRYQNQDFETPNTIKEMMDEMGNLPMETIVSAFQIICERNLAPKIQSVLMRNEPYRISDLALTGNDLKEMGFEREEIGHILKFILDKVRIIPKDNTKKRLREIIALKFPPGK